MQTAAGPRSHFSPLCAPPRGRARRAAGRRPGWHDGGGEVAIHPSSVNHPLEAQQFHRPYLTYLEKVWGSCWACWACWAPGHWGGVGLRWGPREPVPGTGAASCEPAIPRRLQRAQRQHELGTPLSPKLPIYCFHATTTAIDLSPPTHPRPPPHPQVKTSKTFLRDCTVVSPMAILLFGGALRVVHEGGYVLVDEWLRIRCSFPACLLAWLLLILSVWQGWGGWCGCCGAWQPCGTVHGRVLRPVGLCCHTRFSRANPEFLPVVAPLHAAAQTSHLPSWCCSAGRLHRRRCW